jgi:hypothetical protein
MIILKKHTQLPLKSLSPMTRRNPSPLTRCICRRAKWSLTKLYPFHLPTSEKAFLVFLPFLYVRYGIKYVAKRFLLVPRAVEEVCWSRNVPVDHPGEWWCRWRMPPWCPRRPVHPLSSMGTQRMCTRKRSRRWQRVARHSLQEFTVRRWLLHTR